MMNLFAHGTCKMIGRNFLIVNKIHVTQKGIVLLQIASNVKLIVFVFLIPLIQEIK